MIRKKIKRCFTLLELMVSMGVFAILMLALMQFFSSAQNIWTASNAKTELYENAKIAMNLIATDLMNLYYEHGKPGDSPKTFFLAGIMNSSSPPKGELQDKTKEFDIIAFCTLRPEAATAISDPNKKGITRITEVIYFYDRDNSRIYVKNLTDLDAEAASATWCTENNTPDAEGTLLYQAIQDNANWNELISNVAECKFTLHNNKFDSSGTQPQILEIIRNGKEWTFHPEEDSASLDTKGRIPYAVSISLTVLNQESFEKMKAITGKKHLSAILTDEIKAETEPSNETEKVLWQLYHTGKQDFTRVVTIDRGQYN